MGGRSPTNSIERGKRQRRRRLQDSEVLNSYPPTFSSNEQSHSTSDIGASNTSSSQQQSNQGDGVGDTIGGITRFPTGILGGKGGGGGGGCCGGGTAASTAWMLSGPWLQLCSHLSIPIPLISSMRNKGGSDDTLRLAENWIQLYLSTFQCAISDIDAGKWDLRVPVVAGVLRKIRKPREKDLVAQLVDPTGSIECFFQEGALAKYGVDIGVGTAVVAKGVAVWLSNTPGLCRNLCLHADAIQVIWPPYTPRPEDEELIRLQRLSKTVTTMPIDVVLDGLGSSSNHKNNATTISRDVEEEDGWNEAAVTEEEPLNIRTTPQLDAGSLQAAKKNTSYTRTSQEEEDGDDFITAEAFNAEKMIIPSWKWVDQQPSYIEQNNKSSNLVIQHNGCSPAGAAGGPPDFHIKCEEGYYPLPGIPPSPLNCSVTITSTSSNPSTTEMMDWQKLHSSSPAESLHYKGDKNSRTTTCDTEVEVTTRIQKQGEGMMLLQNVSMVGKNEVASLHGEKKKVNNPINTEGETPLKNTNGSNKTKNHVTSFGSANWSSVNSVQDKKQEQQQLAPSTSIMRGWGEALNEQSLFEAALNDSDYD